MSIREAELDRITVKIHNMKRSASRDSPRNKHRGSMGRYDNGGSSDERMSPDRLRRRMARSPSPRGRYMSPHRDEYVRVQSDRPTYKVLCVSALHPKASDEFIKETLYRDYKKFGDFSIRISHDLDERVAYVCFRTPEDAREAKHHKPRVILYDKIALVEPVYESSSRNEYRARPRSITPPPEYDRHYYPRSPVAPPGPPERRRPPIDPYDRYGPPPPGPMHHPREFRPVVHHDYLPPRGPPMHHVPPHMHPPPHHYMPRHMVPRPHIPYEKPESKKDKFPNYLHHVQPEDDPLATRTLFAGNLEVNISDEELRRIFGKYGIVEDIDIKRPPPGTGNAFAFVRYQNLDMAHRAKLELSGQYIGKFQCKIGYGKATPATRIWVGGLGAWTSVTQLEREFDRFGAIKKIEYQKGDTCAYIQYESVEAATTAMKEMRGFPLGGPGKRLRTDFSEIAGAVSASFKAKSTTPAPYEEGGEFRRGEYDYHDPHYDEMAAYHHPAAHYHHPYPPRGGHRGRGIYRGRGAYRGGYHNDVHRPPPANAAEEEWRRPPPGEFDRARSGSREPGVDRSRSRSPRRRSPDSDSDSSSRRNGVLSAARTLTDISRKCSTLWEGSLILKSSLFPAKFHLTDGDSDIVDSLMRDEDGKHNLRITQRLRLDPPKLEDVQKRITSSSSHAIFLGLAAPTAAVPADDAAGGVQTRPLRNLVSYLKQKEAAGVISLLNKETEATGVLYAFPPCDFSTELLKRTCHSVTEDGLKEDHLVIVVVRGGTA
ncbi:RNA-binding protein spenito [Eupeodes corollae]|uniref:RNA-binding protein spenito n=1 Tax=Eupeodes corollae TaxID=290404 RepID=UPI00249216CB|nr:RNA-binding protein spenito [Eupeodes corollae]XP_055916657.1 RNA-binding protein spenito [Eupeodes corollae]